MIIISVRGFSKLERILTEMTDDDLRKICDRELEVTEVRTWK